MEKQKKNRIKKYIAWCLAVTLVVLLATMPLLAGNEKETDGPEASILSVQAAAGEIAEELLGGGTLSSGETVQVQIPAAVKLTEYFVGNGDVVEKGDPVASVDRVTVMTAISQVQETLEYLAEKVEAASDETASDEVVAQAGGTVKCLYAEEGESVQDVMLEHGALAVLSLDGKMAVQIRCEAALAAGENVIVTLPDGTAVEGQVESNLEGVLTAVFDDDGYVAGEEVSVSVDSTTIGTGDMYIHSQWNATAYSGVVADIHVEAGDAVSAGKTLITLADTGHTAQYQQLADQHREYEALMLELFSMYQTKTVTAPAAGVITGVDAGGAYMLSENGTGYVLSLLANAPNGDDETGYVNYVGQVAAVGTDGLVMKLNPQSLQIEDYKDLSGVPLDTALMTQDAIYTAQVPVYALSGDQWVQLDAAAITAGDILLFATDSSGEALYG